MRKVVLFLALVFAVALVGSAFADDTNQTYHNMFDGKNVCKHCHKDKCDTCKPKCDTCKPKCETCKPKCETCKPKCEKPCAPKCEKPCCEKKCCKPMTCSKPCCEPCKPKCNPCKDWEYPNACRADESEMGRNGMSRAKA